MQPNAFIYATSKLLHYLNRGEKYPKYVGNVFNYKKTEESNKSAKGQKICPIWSPR
jgi:hypothetical protein